MQVYKYKDIEIGIEWTPRPHLQVRDNGITADFFPKYVITDKKVKGMNRLRYWRWRFLQSIFWKKKKTRPFILNNERLRKWLHDTGWKTTVYKERIETHAKN